MRSADSSHEPYGGDDPGVSPGVETFSFECEGERLIGIIDRADDRRHRGVLIVVGGPQYRVGSHRQFVILARRMAADGYPVMRFDYRGMGDSAGAKRSFEHINADVKAAIDTFVEKCPGLTEIVLWGLCDAASAICFYAAQDDRVRGVVLVNPWITTTDSAAKTRLKHYYTARLFDRTLWSKLFRGEFKFFESLRDLARTIVQSSGSRRHNRAGAGTAAEQMDRLPDRMARGLDDFRGKIMLILCGRDLTANEFEDMIADSAEWGTVLRRRDVTRHSLPEADHTFSRDGWRNQVIEWTIKWLRSW